MNIFKAIFGMPKAVDAIISTGDALVWTDEERKDWQLKYFQVTNPQNIARRLIALIVCGLWALMIALAVLVWPWKPEWSKFILELMADAVLIPFTTIVGFYFAIAALRARNGK